MKREGFVTSIAAIFASLSLAIAVYGVAWAGLGLAGARLAGLALAAGLSGACLRVASRAGGSAWAWSVCLGLGAGLAGCAYVALSYVSDISTYPLTLGWSEASRYYNASLFFARRIYGADAPPTVLHPSRYLLQAVPFLWPGSPLWLHRAWQVFLWLALPTWTAAVLARRLGLRTWVEKIGLSAAIFLLLMSGPVYYHLLPPVILILWGFRRPPAGAGWRGWIRPGAALLLASAWAGVSRVNWFPVPAMLAAALWVMEETIDDRPQTTDRSASSIVRRLGSAVVLPLAALGALGALTAFAAQAGYILWSGNAAEQFTTSFSSDLLWSRLLPTATNPLGILPEISLVSLPALLAILARLLPLGGPQAGWRRYHPLRLLALAAMLLILFAGGLVVSVKIGGGNNIHNLDAYLCLLAVVGAYFYFGRVADDLTPPPLTPGPSPRRGEGPGVRGGALRLAALLALVIPAAFAVFFRGPAGAPPDEAAARQAIQIIAETARQTAKDGGQVLFIGNRHLLTFHQVKGVALVPEYERVFLMEAAMSGDPATLGRFQADLKNHRFGLIVSEPLSLQQKGADEMFGAENDVWVKRVARPILCYYEPARTLRPVQVQLLVPRPAPGPGCP